MFYLKPPRHISTLPSRCETSKRGERAELFSPVSSFDFDCQCCSLPIQRNRDKLSTRKFDVGVFAQPGSFTGLSLQKRESALRPLFP